MCNRLLPIEEKHFPLLVEKGKLMAFMSANCTHSGAQSRDIELVGELQRRYAKAIFRGRVTSHTGSQGYCYASYFICLDHFAG
jgi:hypothetical protein